MQGHGDVGRRFPLPACVPVPMLHLCDMQREHKLFTTNVIRTLDRQTGPSMHGNCGRPSYHLMYDVTSLFLITFGERERAVQAGGEGEWGLFAGIHGRLGLDARRSLVSLSLFPHSWDPKGMVNRKGKSAAFV